MNYLKKYNLTDKDIEEISSKIDDQDIFEISNNKDRVEKIIDYLKSIGIYNIKDVIMYKSNIFYDDVDTIRNVLSNCSQEMIDAIKEDVINFDLIGI